jgi:hypothetical protein
VRVAQLFTAVILWLGLGAAALGQFQRGDPGGAKLGQSQVQRWRCGLVVEAVGGPCKGIVGYVPCPVEWPEQDVVRIVAEDISPEAKVSYETINESVKVMVVRIVHLGDKQTAKASVTFEVRRSTQLPPDSTDNFTLPDVKKLPRSFQVYLRPSPKIESQDPKIRALAKQVGADQEKAWEKVQAIYNWVRQTVRCEKGSLKGALAALKDGTGHCEDLSALFIAICRAENIPARTVWVPGHCYAEFYLLDDKGQGHWFPCELTEMTLGPSFGGTLDQRPILQKGDNFTPPWDRRKHERYLAEHLAGARTAAGGEPRVRWIRELLP